MNNSMRNKRIGWLTACLMWLAVPAWAGPGNTLESVKISAGQDDSQVLKVVFKDSLTATPAAFTTSNPNRLIIDLPDTANALGRYSEAVDKGNVQSVQVLQSGERTRLVVNLKSPAEYELKTDRNYLLIALRSGASADPATRFAATSPAPSHSVRDIDFRRGKAGEGKLTVTLSSPGIGIDIKQQGRAIQVDFLNTELPASLKRRLDVTDFATAVQTIEAYPMDNRTRLVLTPSTKVSHSAYQTGNQFVIEVSQQQTDFSGSGKAGQYTGERISLDFQNVEIKDLLKVIADFTGQNIVTSDRVTGTTSLRLKEVPWDQALDIILATRGLSRKVISNNVLWVAPSDEIAQLEKRDLEAKQQIYDLEELQSDVIRLNYLRADEAQAILNGQSLGAAAGGQAVSCGAGAAGVGGTTAAAAAPAAAGTGQRILSKRGTTSFDLKTNSLFIQDVPSKLKEARDLLAKVDIPAKQILIEGRVVVAEDAFSRALGAKLGVQTAGNIGATQFGLANTSSAGQSLIGGTVPSGTFTNNIDLPAAGITGVTTNAGIGISLLNAGSNLILNLELQAMEQDKRGKVISSPRVITQNQKPAVIMQGQQIPYTQTTTTTTTTVFQNAVLCLLVNPQILNNDDIILDVEITKDAPGAGTGNSLQIDTQRVKTQIRVRNGETAILGGIFEQTLRDDTNKVPLLGDIPVVGHLFKNNSKIDNKKELMIFITPRVLPEGLAGIQ
ncbi:MAG: type IV pilus secretin PilQ [Hydrogenophilaceae bacterium]|nr:type IV pilus secretin PilQ [Hydrogenophilaceae bacterium]